MSQLDELVPTEKKTVYDLVVKEAGVTISDWHESEKANPHYCYNWSFVSDGQFVVLSRWHENFKEKDGLIFDEFNPKKMRDQSSGVVLHRAEERLKAIEYAYKYSLPVKVIICIGHRRDVDDPTSVTSRVDARSLDSELWYVKSYDEYSGHTVLIRGLPFFDQFSSFSNQKGGVRGKEITSNPFLRSSEVRSAVLLRARGKCEYCGESGFLTGSGVYLETHHVIPLSENGLDSIANVVALCPNHHREAHYGEQRLEIQRRLQEYLRELP